MGSSRSGEYTMLEGDEEIAVPAVESLSGYDSNLAIAKKLLCEFIGSFILVLGGAGSAIMNNKSNGALGINGLAGGAGIPVAIVIMATGHISGAHINPVVTLAFATFRHFSWLLVPLYIVVQFLASIAAAFFLKFMYEPVSGGYGVTVPQGSDMQSLVFEIVLTTILMFVITSVATDTRAVGELAGIAIGLTIYLNVLLGGYISGTSMNPVRTLGPAIASGNYKSIWIYFVGPLLGAQLGAGLYTLIRFKDQEKRRKAFRKE